jgi:hypothetical protein
MVGTWIMKTFQFSPVKLLALAMACSFASGATTQAGANARDYAMAADNCRLVVHRGADFGTEIALKVFIDGIPVTTLAINEGYEALVRPGQHVLSIRTIPSFDDKTKFTYQTVAMRRGQSYAYTALWVEADRALLVRPDVARRANWRGR